MTEIAKKYHIFLLILLGYITVLAFYPSLTAGFSSLDDCVMVEQNQYIRDISFANIKYIFSHIYFKLYHPLVTLSYALEYHFFGLDTWIYHADNIVLHFINVILVFFIFKKLTKSLVCSFAIALLFSIHPTRIETVSWISSRKDLICTLFYLSAYLCYVKSYDSVKYRLFLLLSFLLFILACMSKPMAVTFPAIIVLTDFCFGKFSIKKYFKYIPFVIISLILCIVTINGYYSEQQINCNTLYTRLTDLLNAQFYVLYYFKIFFYPVYYFIHPPFYNTNQMYPDGIFYYVALLWIIIFFAVYSLKYTKKIFFGLIFFFIILLPVSGVMQTGISPVTDRYSYCALIGLFYLAAEFMLFIYKKFPKLKYLLCAIFLVISLCMFYTTYLRACLWQDNEKLIELAIDSFPDTADNAYLMHGMHNIAKKDFKAAKIDLDKSLKINPTSPILFFNIGHLAQLQGDNEKAFKCYNKIPKDSADFPASICNKSIIIHDQKETEKAIKLIEDNIKNTGDIMSDFLYCTLAKYYFELGDYKKAEENILKAVTVNPGNENNYYILLNIYKKLDDIESIKNAVHKFSVNCKNISELFEFTAIYFFEKEMYSEAEKMFWLSFKDKTKNSTANFFLGNIYAIKQDYNRAIFFYTNAVLQNKNNGEYNFKRAAAHFFNEQYDLAFRDMNTAIKKGFDVPEEFSADLAEKLKIKTGEQK